jgi:hypothetical protein
MKNNIDRSIIILHVRKHAAEIDWILPLIYKFNYKINLVTIFNNEECYKSLVLNKSLYKLWHSICTSYYIENSHNNFFYKILFKIILLFEKIGFKKLIIIKEYILNKIYNLNEFENFLKIKISDIKVLFLVWNNYSYWANIFKKINSNILITRFPESNHIWSYASSIKKFLKNTNYKKLPCDLYLSSNESNLISFFGEINKPNIDLGYIKYEKHWIKKINGKIIKDDYFFNIAVATRPFFHGVYKKPYFSSSSYYYLIDSIMKIAATIKNSRVFFKVHPNSEDEEILKKALDKYKAIKWKIVHEHLFCLAKRSDVCISFYSSAVLDFLACEKPTIEFWRSDIDNIDLIYDRLNKRHSSIYNKLGLVFSANDYMQLSKLIYKIYEKKADKMILFQKQRFINKILSHLIAKRKKFEQLKNIIKV